jgi:hypothetical protein
MSKPRELASLNTNLMNSKIAVDEVYSIPSIPGQREKYGYVINQNVLTYPKFVPRPRAEGDTPGPSDYSLPLNRQARSVLNFSNQTTTLNRNDSTNSAEFSALVNDK